MPDLKSLRNGFIDLPFSRKRPLAQNATLDGLDEQPLRAELFSTVQMEQHGRSLAQAHVVGEGKVRDRLLARLANNEIVLLEACSVLTSAVQQERQLTPAAEWLLDNFYLIEEQIRTAKRHLPKGYSKELPRLSMGPSAGQPRVYDIALETISHGDGRVDPESLRRFIAAYQHVTPLRLGELWAIPIMLRLALIENLRRVAARLSASRDSRNLADTWVDQMTTIAEKDPSSLIMTVADMARSDPPLDSAFVAELARRLRGQSLALTLPLTWISQRLAESGGSIEQLVQQEGQQQAADQVSVSNSIGSLRSLGSVDWREFVETMSVVETTLREDVGQVYAQMDFATRDHYRHVIEKIAKRSRLQENEIARHAIALAQTAAGIHGKGNRRAHVGYYLIDDGLPQLEQVAKAHLSPLYALNSAARRTPLRLYLGGIFLVSLVTAVVLGVIGWQQGMPAWLLAVLALPMLVAGSHFGLGLVNWVLTLTASPRPLARMNFTEGIPPQYPTLVVVPTLLTSIAAVDQLAEALEVRFLANRDAQLQFCLLTDFADAATETIGTDGALLAHARITFEQLNHAYQEVNDGPFLLLHRPRHWNPVEKTWMGYERKRGKLADLNGLLRGGETAPFSLIIGDTSRLQDVKYVITLDSDTQLPREAARQFVAAMAHPLNHPVFDPAARRITHGYGILQPRVAISLPAVDASWYELLCSGEAGIDPYTRAVSDVYQDVFGEGSFVGKGIYDVDAFEQVFAGRFPENRVLSHDLIEGCYARAGLMSDVLLFEQYPARYQADVARRHRWIRGDWQLASWLLPSVPAGAPTGMLAAATRRGGWSSRIRNPLSGLSRWKLFDNLRRSGVPAVLVTLMIAGWFQLREPGLWTAVLAAVVLFTAVTASLLDFARKSDDVLLRQHFRAALRTGGRHLAHALLTLSFLPHEAFYSMDAIVRTNWRLMVSHRRLLEWKASSQTSREGSDGLAGELRAMWFSPVLALAIAGALYAVHPHALDSALPLLLLWLVAPLTSWRISQPVVPKVSTVAPSQLAYLHRLSRKTWGFFETYVGPEDNWLPPDNVQEQPVAVIARRTSPTNIGLSLLATLAAYDFGYIPAGQLLERIGNTLRTMAALERHQGHFYNWYDTQYLKPLLPIYISTVDSGNLGAHLLTLRPGLLDLVTAPIVPLRLWQGIADTLHVLLEQDAASGSLRSGVPATLVQFKSFLDAAIERPPTTLPTVMGVLLQLTQQAQAFVSTLTLVPETPHNWWARALARQCMEAQQELIYLAPWLAQPTEAVGASIVLDGIPTLQQLARTPLATAGTSPALVQMLQDTASRAVERIKLIEQLVLQTGDFARMEYGFLYDPATHLMAIGYNLSERRRDVSYYDLLASEARLGQFRRNRPGPDPSGQLVRPRPSADSGRRRPDPAVVERLDVRVPDAVAGDAEFPQHAARPDLQVIGTAPDRIRCPAQCTVGHFGVGLQYLRREPELPVPRLRRAGAGIEARPGR